VHIFNWAFTEGGENGLVSRWGGKGCGREQADEEDRGTEEGKGNHGDAKGLIRRILATVTGSWVGSERTEVKTQETRPGGYQVVSGCRIYSSQAFGKQHRLPLCFSFDGMM
jgi:hypothetical protein